MTSLYSALLQSGTVESSGCPPEGGRYIAEYEPTLKL